jgi:hypothetical protein
MIKMKYKINLISCWFQDFIWRKTETQVLDTAVITTANDYFYTTF